jgi:hypothetical protein
LPTRAQVARARVSWAGARHSDREQYPLADAFRGLDLPWCDLGPCRVRRPRAVASPGGQSPIVGRSRWPTVAGHHTCLGPRRKTGPSRHHATVDPLSVLNVFLEPDAKPAQGASQRPDRGNRVKRSKVGVLSPWSAAQPKTIKRHGPLAGFRPVPAEAAKGPDFASHHSIALLVPCRRAVGSGRIVYGTQRFGVRQPIRMGILPSNNGSWRTGGLCCRTQC